MIISYGLVLGSSRPGLSRERLQGESDDLEALFEGETGDLDGRPGSPGRGNDAEADHHIHHLCFFHPLVCSHFTSPFLDPTRLEVNKERESCQE